MCPFLEPSLSKLSQNDYCGLLILYQPSKIASATSNYTYFAIYFSPKQPKNTDLPPLRPQPFFLTSPISAEPQHTSPKNKNTAHLNIHCCSKVFVTHASGVHWLQSVTIHTHVELLHTLLLAFSYYPGLSACRRLLERLSLHYVMRVELRGGSRDQDDGC